VSFVLTTSASKVVVRSTVLRSNVWISHNLTWSHGTRSDTSLFDNYGSAFSSMRQQQKFDSIPFRSVRCSTRLSSSLTSTGQFIWV